MRKVRDAKLLQDTELASAPMKIFIFESNRVVSSPASACVTLDEKSVKTDGVVLAVDTGKDGWEPLSLVFFNTVDTRANDAFVERLRNSKKK